MDLRRVLSGGLPVALTAVALTVLASLAFAPPALAMFGPHVAFEDDTDACAGCHRAHTSFSPLRWTDSLGNSHSALLVSTATTMEEFCMACHGDAAPGASTNVVSGIFDGGPSAPSPGGTFATNSTFAAPLNGGGFSLTTEDGASFTSVTSVHDTDDGIRLLWGDGSSAADTLALTCTSCHDPHGSSNYRILKDMVNGHSVGGYVDSGDPDDPDPEPYVISAEQGYPVGGWRLHEPGVSQLATYVPNYTDAQHAYLGPGVGGYRSMSAWCSACHERYIVRDDTTGTAPVPWVTVPGAYDYGQAESWFDGATTRTVGPRARHRHPVNVTLAAGIGPARALQREVVTSAVLPLEFDGMGRSSADFRATGWDASDYIGCLTCHVAHGTSAIMTGWAESSLMSTTNASAAVTWYPVLSLQPTTSGVNPTFSSALLRSANRGVCERCHNK